MFHFTPFAGAAIVAAAVTTTAAAIDPLVAVAAVSALATVGVAFINGRVARANANIAALRDDAKDAHSRADRAQRRADEASERVADLEDEVLKAKKTVAALQIWSIRVSTEMRTHGLTPPPLPE